MAVGRVEERKDRPRVAGAEERPGELRPRRRRQPFPGPEPESSEGRGHRQQEQQPEEEPAPDRQREQSAASGQDKQGGQQEPGRAVQDEGNPQGDRRGDSAPLAVKVPDPEQEEDRYGRDQWGVDLDGPEKEGDRPGGHEDRRKADPAGTRGEALPPEPDGSGCVDHPREGGDQADRGHRIQGEYLAGAGEQPGRQGVRWVDHAHRGEKQDGARVAREAIVGQEPEQRPRHGDGQDGADRGGHRPQPAEEVCDPIREAGQEEESEQDRGRNEEPGGAELAIAVEAEKQVRVRGAGKESADAEQQEDHESRDREFPAGDALLVGLSADDVARRAHWWVSVSVSRASRRDDPQVA
jgi:hypothetical protein